MMIRAPRRVVAVSGDWQRPQMLDRLSGGENVDDVIFVDSLEKGYSRIKRVSPDLVIIVMEIDDVAGCQLLTMLTTDRNVSGIPVVTCTAEPVDDELVDIVSGLVAGSSDATHVMEMN
jgi:DNA-binding response OmpR family regulator